MRDENKILIKEVMKRSVSVFTFLENGQCFATSALFKFLEIESQRLFQPFIENVHAEGGNCHLCEVVLKSPGNSCCHGHTYCYCQPEYHAVDELLFGP